MCMSAYSTSRAVYKHVTHMKFRFNLFLFCIFLSATLICFSFSRRFFLIQYTQYYTRQQNLYTQRIFFLSSAFIHKHMYPHGTSRFGIHTAEISFNNFCSWPKIDFCIIILELVSFWLHIYLLLSLLLCRFVFNSSSSIVTAQLHLYFHSGLVDRSKCSCTRTAINVKTYFSHEKMNLN